MKTFSSLCLCLLLTACSSLRTNIDRQANTTKVQQVNPYHLELIDELYDGEKLFLKLQLEQREKNRVAAYPTFLAVETYANGELGSEKYYLLEDLEFDHESAVILSVDAVRMSDYQLKLYWGKEAQAFYAKIYPELISSLELSEIKVEKLQICKDECQFRYNLDILLKNNSDITIPEASLLVNLVEDVDSVSISEGLPVFQQKIPLKALNLASKSSRKLNFVLVEPKELVDMALQVQVKLD